MKFISIVLISTFILANAAFAETLDNGELHDQQGSTKTHGSYHLYTTADNKVKLDVHFSVKKTGISGTGFGIMSYAIVGADGNSIVRVEKGFSVGANALKGVAVKEFNQSFSFFGGVAQKLLNEGAGSAFLIDATRDTNGIPTSVGEWTNLLGGASIPQLLAGLGKGGTKQLGQWLLKKIIH